MNKYLKKISKLLTLIVIVFSTSGCYAEYEVSLINFHIEEKIYINENNSLNYNNSTPNSYRYYVDKLLSTYTDINYSDDQDYFLTIIEEGFDGYKKTLNTNLGYGVELSASYTLSSYFSGTAIKTCYDRVDFEDINNVYSIETSDAFLCLSKFVPADYVKIHFRTDYNIIYSNADSVLNDGTLEWTINNSNYENKPIKIKTGSVYEDEESSDEYSSSRVTDEESSDTVAKDIAKGNSTLIIIFFSMIGIVLIFAVIVYLKYKKTRSYK